MLRAEGHVVYSDMTEPAYLFSGLHPSINHAEPEIIFRDTANSQRRNDSR